MQVYKINSIIDQGDILNFDPYSIYQSLKSYKNISESELMIKVFDLHINNDSIRDMWPSVMPVKALSPLYKNVDLYVQGGFLILSEKALSYLTDYLRDYGEFLSIEVESKKMALFNLHVFGQEDLDKCVEDYSKGVRSGFKSFSFVDSDINEKLLFKSKLLDGIGFFCTEKFKCFVESKGFRGIEFELI